MNKDAALEYVARGWHVFPLQPDNKRPYPGTRGHLDATDDPEIVHQWWEAAPEANIGVSLEPSGLVVLDVDVKDGAGGLESLEAIDAELTPTLTARTGSGGLHAVYKRTDERQAQRKIRWKPGIDLLGKGYIVAPPSTASGNAYEWIATSEFADTPPILDQAFGELPEPVALEDRDEYPPADAELLEHVRRCALDHGPSVKGQGGDQHAYVLGAMLLHDFALSWDEAWPIALEWNQRFPENQWSESALATKLRNGATYAQGPYGEDRDAYILPLVRELAPPAPEPSGLEVKSALKAKEKGLARKSDPQAQLDRHVLKKVLAGDPLEDEAIPHAAGALRRAAPMATDEQLVGELELSVGPDRARQAFEAEPAETISESAGPFVMNPQTGKPAPTQANIDAALAEMGLMVWYDEFADRDMLEAGGSAPVPIDDALERRIWLQCDADFGLKTPREFFHEVVSDRAYQNRRHPVREYLDALEWDGTERIGRWLSAYGGAPDSPYTRAVGRLTLIAAVRRVRSPGCKFDEMLILESDQGTDKSSALKILATCEDWFSDNLPLAATTQRQMEALAGHWIVEAGELAGMRRSEVGELKSFLSRTVDKARMAYGRRTQRQPRQCVIIGTTNDAEFLKDATGNRRFWPVTVKGFDTEALRRDRDQLWAEAAAAEAAGESIRLDPSLYGDAEGEQEQRRIADPYTEILGEVFGDVEGRVLSMDVYKVLGLSPGSATIDQRKRMGQSMRELGFESSRARVGGGQRKSIWVRGKAAKSWLELRPGQGFPGFEVRISDTTE